MSRDAQARTEVRDDGEFVRTAIVVGPGPTKAGRIVSLDIVTEAGDLLLRLNVTSDGGSYVIVDSIDEADRFTKRAAVAFPRNVQKRIQIDKTARLVSADFRNEEDSEPLKE